MARASMMPALVATSVLGQSDRIEEKALGQKPVYSPENIARFASQKWLGRSLSTRAATRAGAVLRWTYGPVLGLAYAWGRRRIRRDAWYVVGFTVLLAAGELVALPAARLTPRLRDWPRPQVPLLFLHALVFVWWMNWPWPAKGVDRLFLRGIPTPA